MLEKIKKYRNSYIVKGSFWWILGKIAQIFISFGRMWVFAHFLSKETYGTYKYINSFSLLLSIFTLPGMNEVLVREIARKNEGFFEKAKDEKLRWGFVGTFLSFLIALWYFLHNNSFLGSLFIIIGWFLPFTNAFGIFPYFWQGKKRFDLQTKYLLLNSFLSSAIIILLVILSGNLVLILLISSLTLFLLNFFFYKLTLSKIKIAKNNSKSNSKSAIKFGKHLSIIHGFSIFSAQMDKIIIWQLLGAENLAIYAFAQVVVTKIHELSPLFPLSLPKLSEKGFVQKSYLLKKFGQLFLLSIPLTLLVISLLPFLYTIFFPKYQASIPYAQISAISLLFIPFSLLRSYFYAKSCTKFLYFLHFLHTFLSVLLLYLLIPSYNLLGAAIANLLALFITNLVALLFFLRS